MNRQRFEGKLARFPIFQYEFIKTEDLVFSENVRYICEAECQMYGKTWACPPAVGSVESCKKRCLEYEDAFLFTTIAEVSDIENMDEMLSTRSEHENITAQVAELMRDESEKVYVLSTEACSRCKKCTYPSAPCRHPDKMFPCVESHGIVVTDIAEKYGISFLNGNNVVTWFSIILYE